MEGIDERYLNVARQIRDRLSERHWSEVVDVSRTMTMDYMSLDDIPAVALAFSGRRCSRSASKAAPPSSESKCPLDREIRSCPRVCMARRDR